MDILGVVIISGLLWVAVMFVLTILYRFTPFKSHLPPKPSFVFFPKYEAVFGCSPDAVRQSLLSSNFDVDHNNANVFDRGKSYGDFSIKKAKLRAEIDPDRSTMRLYTPWVILFDTGDTWQVTDDILSAARDKTIPR